jgi:hypothetical protein
VFARLLLHVTNYLMEQAILFGMDLSEQEIRAELELLFRAQESWPSE